MKSGNRSCICLMLVVLAGCSKVMVSINAYHAVAPRVHLGMTRDEVLAILEPIQKDLSVNQRKAPEEYYKDGKHVEIYFYPCYSNYDEVKSDDEFMPYVFSDGKLESIGWTALGGPGTQATPRPEQHITVIR